MREVYFSTKQAVRLNKEKGFTLIELLVVIAIIAILAAIAIPQFAQFRMRAFNSAAESDIRNLRTAEEALYADYFVYGSTQGPGNLPSSGSFCVSGVVLSGPMGPATATGVTGAYIAGTYTETTATGGTAEVAVSVGISVSSQVDMQANVNSSCQTYTAVAHHNGGDTAYGIDAESTSIYVQKNANFAGDTRGSLPVSVPTPTSNIDFSSPWRAQ